MNCLKGSWNFPLEMSILKLSVTIYKKNHWEAKLNVSDPSDFRLLED